jgi:hypothetical protein
MKNLERKKDRADEVGFLDPLVRRDSSQGRAYAQGRLSIRVALQERVGPYRPTTALISSTTLTMIFTYDPMVLFDVRRSKMERRRERVTCVQSGAIHFFFFYIDTLLCPSFNASLFFSLSSSTLMVLSQRVCAVKRGSKNHDRYLCH